MINQNNLIIFVDNLSPVSEQIYVILNVIKHLLFPISIPVVVTISSSMYNLPSFAQ